MEGLSVLDMIRQGALVTYPLIVMSMVTITIICELLWALRGLVSGSLRVAGAVVGPLQKGDFRTALTTAQQNQKAPAGRVLRDVVSQQEGESLEYLAEVAEDRRAGGSDANENRDENHQWRDDEQRGEQRRHGRHKMNAVRAKPIALVHRHPPMTDPRCPSNANARAHGLGGAKPSPQSSPAAPPITPRSTSAT